MKRVHAFLPATALLMVLAGCGAGTSTTAGGKTVDAVAVPADGIDFNIIAKEGDTMTYQAMMSMDVKGPAQAGGSSDFNVQADMKQVVKVIKVEDGKISTETSFADVEVKGTQMAADAIRKTLQDSKSSVTIDKKGRVVKQSGQVDANAMAGGNLYFPDNKVKVGETWDRTAPMTGAAPVKAVYKFEGTEKLNGVDVARISVRPEGDKASTGSFTYWVDIATGMAIKANGEIISEANGGKMVMKMDIKKV